MKAPKHLLYSLNRHSFHLRQKNPIINPIMVGGIGKVDVARAFREVRTNKGVIIHQLKDQMQHTPVGLACVLHRVTVHS